MSEIYTVPPELVLGQRLNTRVPRADQERQRAEVDDILRRLRTQSGVILADEVGMGKTFVALAVAYSVAARSPRGPVIVMVPSNLVDKWKQDLSTFCELYLDGRRPLDRDVAKTKDLTDPSVLRYGVALHSVELMKLLDDPSRVRSHLIFLAQRAMSRRQSDKWIRLALVAETLRRHGRGKANRLIQVKEQIHRYLAELMYALGEQRAQDLGVELWKRLLRTDPGAWKDTYNRAVRDERRQMSDDPVPKAVVRALQRIDLKPLAGALEEMPVRARGGDRRVSERLEVARKALRTVETELWKDLLARTQWRSPLLVMDEAHHLKNPDTSLARQFKTADLDQDIRTGDAAMANAFDRMLFLTATPFQLGHHELVQVLTRFGDVRWQEQELGERESFKKKMADLWHRLDDSQRAAVALQRCWSRLRPEDCGEDVEAWWCQLLTTPRDSQTNRQRAVVEAYESAKRGRGAAEQALRSWVVRHNKGIYWAGFTIKRRQRVDGAAIANDGAPGGLPIPPQQLLPFFLAARSVVKAGKDLLGEALCSSYEAFRLTRQDHKAAKDTLDDEDASAEIAPDLSHARWYLREFDQALQSTSGAMHPKISATVKKVVDLWEAGEKVLVFAFYRRTCRALRIHISQDIERRMFAAVQRRLGDAGRETDRQAIERLLEGIQKRFVDDPKSPGRRALDQALAEIIGGHTRKLDAVHMSKDQRDLLTDVMRRFLRVTTTLVRCFPIEELANLRPAEVVSRALEQADGSGTSWRQKFDGFINFLVECSANERLDYLEAARRTQTGGIRVEDAEADDSDATVTLANVQVAMGTTKRETRARLMRAFNTPFFPDIFVCSEVMGEGVDLQRFCRHVIHHDLAWNPSTIEQRTGRIDRLGCKAEGRQPIVVYLPYMAGTADERQYQVMSDREQWFRVVMGQEEVARLITPHSSSVVRLPEAVSNELSFKLGLD
ncbi:MAG: helicase-related protein [Candidatus Acidiferrum sp.]